MKYYNIFITLIAIFFIFKIAEIKYNFHFFSKNIIVEEYAYSFENYVEENYASETFNKIEYKNFPELSTATETYLKLYKIEINQSSEKWGIPPLAIAGIISAESTLNFNGAHRLEEYYFKNFILNKTEDEVDKMIAEANVANLYNERLNFFSKIHRPATWSIGLCQMHLDIATEIEPLKAQIENREPKTNRELIGALLDPRSNIDYCAFYMLTIRNKYKNELKVDLFERPSLLVTIYNIGRIDELIKRRKGIGETKIENLNNNWFGAFSFAKREKINAILKVDKVQIENCVQQNIPANQG